MNDLPLDGEHESYRDITWAEFSTLDVCYKQKQPYLKLKTQPKQRLGYFLLSFTLPSPD